MKTYNLPDNINVFGFAVSSFPQGVGEAFDVLIKKQETAQEMMCLVQMND